MFCFKQPISESKLTVPLRRSDEELRMLWEKDILEYGSKVKIPFWRETVYALPQHVPLGQIDLCNPPTIVTTSYMAQAVRENIEGAERIFPLTVEGIIRTVDERLVLGARTGPVQNGRVSLIPVGYCGMGSTFAEQFRAEAREEAGAEFSEVQIIGYQTDPEFTRGVNIVFVGNTSLSAKDLEHLCNEAQRVGNEAYTRVIAEISERGKARKAAKQAIRDAGLPNVDALDHEPYFFIEDSYKTVSAVLSSRTITAEQSGRTYPLMGICLGGLEAYTEQRWSNRK